MQEQEKANMMLTYYSERKKEMECQIWVKEFYIIGAKKIRDLKMILRGWFVRTFLEVDFTIIKKSPFVAPMLFFFLT